MKRRDFVLGGLTAPWLVACASQGDSAGNWPRLQGAMDGELLLPDNAAFADNARLFNTRFDAIRPSAVARCRTVRDVRACIAFARRNNIPLHTRSGRHSYAGWSTGPGLVVDVSPMNQVDLPAGSTIATIGAGAKLIDIYDGLAAHGRTLPGGSCPTVGIAGFALGGGISMLGRAYGLACDSIRQVEIVTAAGDVLTCDARHHADLFWACRGGGGGNFGIVTSFQFQTHPLTNITTLNLDWDWTHAPQVMKAWQTWAPTAPDAAWSNCRFLTNRTGPAPGPRVRILIVFLGDAATLEPMLADLLGPIGTAPTRTVETMEGLYALRTLGGCQAVTIAQCHLTLTSVDGRLNRPAMVGKSSFFDKPFSDEAIATAMHHIELAQAMPGLSSGTLLLDAFGGAIGRVDPAQTAFAHRTALFSSQFLAYWQVNADAPTVEGCRSWIRGFHEEMLPHSSGGAYVNYTDPELRDWQHAYYGANYDRLVQVKAAYDPTGLFKLPQGIPVA